MSKSIIIDGVEYAPVSKNVTNTDGLELAVIRTYSAGVFYGYVKKIEGEVIELVNSRRIWYWDGAASLSQLAQEGVTKPESCKIAMHEPIKFVRGWIEITPVTEKAQKSLDAVPVWKK